MPLGVINIYLSIYCKMLSHHPQRTTSRVLMDSGHKCSADRQRRITDCGRCDMGMMGVEVERRGMRDEVVDEMWVV